MYIQSSGWMILIHSDSVHMSAYKEDSVQSQQLVYPARTVAGSSRSWGWAMAK